MARPPQGFGSQPIFPNAGFPAPAPPPWEPTPPGMTPGPGMPPPPGLQGFPPGGPPIPGFPGQPFNPLPGLQNLNIPLFPPDLFNDMELDLDFGPDFDDEPSDFVPVPPGGFGPVLRPSDPEHPDYQAPGQGMGQPQSFMPEDMPYNYYAGMQFGGQSPRRRRRPPSFMRNIPYASQLGPIAGYLG